MRINVFEVMESMKAKEEAPQHLQLVPVVRFYQKLQSLLAVPKNEIRRKKNESVFLSFAATSLEVTAFNLNAIFPSTAVRSLPWGVL